MSTVHPKTILQDGQVVGVDEFSDKIIRPYVDLLSGGVDEHNLASGLIPEAQRTNKIVEAAAFMATLTRGGASGHTTDRMGGTDPYDPAVAPASVSNLGTVHHTGEWEEVLGQEIVVNRAGILMCFASANVCDDSWGGTTVGAEIFGGQWALALDNAVIPESGIGCFDPDNETFEQNAVNLGNRRNSGSTGTNHFIHPIRLIAPIPVTEGKHRVSLMGRSVGADLATPKLRVFERQLFTIQLIGARQIA